MLLGVTDSHPFPGKVPAAADYLPRYFCHFNFSFFFNLRHISWIYELQDFSFFNYAKKSMLIVFSEHSIKLSD